VAFDNRHTTASRRTVIPPVAPSSRTFTKGIALGVVVGAVSATLTYAALFAGPSRTTALIASASVANAKPSAAAAARTDAGPDQSAAMPAAPVSTGTISETKNEPAPSPPVLASSEPAAATVAAETKPQVQREESRPRHKRERHTARRERTRNGWYGDAGGNPYARSSRDNYRGRSEWSW
jgi:type IV secretory pathway VirB10-like protein